MPSEEAPAIRAANRRYHLRLAASIVAYAVVLMAVNFAIGTDAVTGPLRFVVAGLPILPLFGIPAALSRWLRETDEFQRRVALEGLAIGFAAGSILTFGYGFLQVAGAPDASWLFVWPVYAVCWGIGTALAQRHYRGEG